MSNSRGHRLQAGKYTNLGTLVLSVPCVFPGGCRDTDPPEMSAIQSAINRSSQYLVDSTKDDGMFEYRINMDPSVEVVEKYNILRHAGAIYAMCMHHQHQPDGDMRPAIERAGKYLRDEAIRPVPGRDDLLAVWSKPEINRSGDPLQAKLGGTGLGLVALLSMEKIQPGFTPLPDL